MNNVFRQFYNSFYVKTNGFIPTMPLNLKVYPGDFFQIKNGEMIVLGNIFRNGVIDLDEVDLEYGVKLNPANWEFSKGVTKPYSGRSSGQSNLEGDFNFTRQILAFENRGSFSFKGRNPEVVKYSNWREIQQELIIKLTQVYYSFRELYLVTDVATTEDWTLAIAGTDNAELEIAIDSEDFGLVNIFGHEKSNTVQAKDIEYYNREKHRNPVFFKAQKLVVQNEKIDVFINELIQESASKGEWVESFFDYNFHKETSYFSPSQSIAETCILEMLRSNELNPNTALLYFGWDDASMDDIELFF